CASHCQASEKRPGALTRPPHFGQLGSPLIDPHGPSSAAPRQGRSPVRTERAAGKPRGRHLTRPAAYTSPPRIPGLGTPSGTRWAPAPSDVRPADVGDLAHSSGTDAREGSRRSVPWFS